MSDDFYISVRIPREKAEKARTFHEWQVIVNRALEASKWQNKTAMKSFWTRAIWDDLGRPTVDERRAM